MTNPLEKDDEFQMSLANPNPSFKARKDGDHYFIDFELSKEEWDWFVDPNISRTGMVVEVAGRVTHRAGKSQSKLDHPKGGPLAKWAGIICSDPEFWRWLKVNDEDSARAVVIQMCGINSRAELDHNPVAGRIFRERFMCPFSAWRGAQGR